MNKMTISGAEYRLRKIFSDEFVFTIPLYQRPYAWTTEQSEELLQDLLRAMQGNEEPIEELPPYFLGSIVLIKGDEAGAQVINLHEWTPAILEWRQKYLLDRLKLHWKL